MAIVVGDSVEVVGGTFEGQSGVVTKLNGTKKCTVDLGAPGIHMLALTSVQAVAKSQGANAVVHAEKKEVEHWSEAEHSSNSEEEISHTEVHPDGKIVVHRRKKKRGHRDTRKNGMKKKEDTLVGALKVLEIDGLAAPNFAHGGRGANGQWIRKDYEDWLRKNDVSQATIKKMNVPDLKKEIFAMCR